MSFQTINPANDEIIKHYEEFTAGELNSIIDKTDLAFKSWRKTSFNYRSDLMRNAATILRERKREYGQLMAIEMGKPINQGIAEAEKCAWVCDFYADNAESFLNDMSIKTDASKSFVSFLPLGTVLAIMPWNFPFWQVFRFAAPALMAGNVGLLKHSRNTMGCACKIEEIFMEAGFPEYTFKNLIIGSAPVESIIRNPKVTAVTLTGSTPVGAEVAKIAGSQIKKTVMELGGSDPYIILKDADLAKAAEICVNARLINSGQSCIAAKRFIIEEPVYDKFVGLFTEIVKSRKMGDPLDESNHIGPQARKDLQLELHEQVLKSQALGAELLVGGQLPDTKGYYYPATVLGNCIKGMPAYDEELFGPVAAMIKASNEDEAVEIANDTIFGLGAAIFTSDIDKGERIAREELNAGACFVNDSVKSDPRMPFGGVKESGYGRELACFGIREFMNIKSVVVK